MGDFRTEKIGTDEFLCYVLDELDVIDRVACGMMENNTIAGLLPMNYSQLNDKISVQFCISGMMTLEDYMDQASSSHQILLQLKEIANTVADISDYMLEESQCIFEPEHIYVDETERAGLICIPIEQGELDSGFRAFCTSIINLPKVVHDIQYSEYVNLKRYLSQETVLAREFATLLETVELNSAIIPNDGEHQIEGKIVLGRAQRNEVVILSRTETPRPPVQTVPLQSLQQPVILSRDSDSHQAPIILSRNDSRNSDVLGQTMLIERGPEVFERKPMTVESRSMIKVMEPGDETAYLTTPQSTAILRRKRTGEDIRIEQDTFRIGKNRMHNDYCILDNPTVSRHHAVIRRRGNMFFLADQNSKNGTYINGKLLEAQQEIPLMDQTEITLSDEEFLFILY